MSQCFAAVENATFFRTRRQRFQQRQPHQSLERHITDADPVNHTDFTKRDSNSKKICRRLTSVSGAHSLAPTTAVWLYPGCVYLAAVQTARKHRCCCRSREFERAYQSCSRDCLARSVLRGAFQLNGCARRYRTGLDHNDNLLWLPHNEFSRCYLGAANANDSNECGRVGWQKESERFPDRERSIVKPPGVLIVIRFKPN